LLGVLSSITHTNRKSTICQRMLRKGELWVKEEVFPQTPGFTHCLP
jgi:hypothetical protein